MTWSTHHLEELALTYGPPLVKALLILVVGWLFAKLVSVATRKLLTKTELDDKLANLLTGGRSSEMAVEDAFAKFAYWLILLFVFMAVLQSLGLTIVTEPLNALLTRITSFLPQVLAAGLLILIAWAVATVLRTVLRNLLSAFQLDEKLGEQAGLETGEGKRVSLATTLADAAYYLVFLLFLPQVLDALAMDGLAPVRDMVGEILGFLPNLLGAGVIFAIFVMVARIVQRLITNLLSGVGFDQLPVWMGFEKPAEGTMAASTMAGWLVFGVMLFLGAIQALRTLGLEVISSLAGELLEGLFKVVVAAVIFAVGLLLSRMASKAILASGKTQAGILAFVARAAILIFAGAMALRRTDLAPEIVNLAFGALIVGCAVAAGLAFGLGGREAAAQAIEGWKRSLRGEG